MSDFVTKIPVDLESILKLLPPGHDLLGKPTFDPDTGEVSIIWHHQALVTPYSFPMDYPVALLQEGKLPENAKQKELKAPNVNINVDKPAKTVRKGSLK